MYIGPTVSDPLGHTGTEEELPAKRLWETHVAGAKGESVIYEME